MNFLSLVTNIGRFLFALFKFLLVTATVLVISAAIVGHTVRDRTVELGLLMYIPLLPLGLWAVCLDISLIGRSLPKFRFGLTLIGLGIITWGSLSMIGMADTQTNLEPSKLVSVLHWNVHWGGGRKNWKSIRNDIEQRNPDIAIISEPPGKNRFKLLLKQMNWSKVMHKNTASNTLAVCSSLPLRFERRLKIRNGKAMIAVVTVRGQSLRVLAVDGNRNMSRRHVVLSRQLLPRWRTPMLTDVAKNITAAHKRGQPIDIIAGDFNAISLSSGFDAFANAGGGYNLASKFSNGWRGTWKSYLPLYDIDHVWVHKSFSGLRAKLFTNLKSDHRGQLVQFQLPVLYR
jgi:endonuclease/exonuclease/phosphatase (EEP) superfamily protein YafD